MAFGLFMIVSIVATTHILVNKYTYTGTGILTPHLFW